MSPSEGPIAILPDYIHPRMKSQKSCFTLHGQSDEDFQTLIARSSLPKEFFGKYVINKDAAPSILRELHLLGITHCSVFPSHDGLAAELRRVFGDHVASVAAGTAVSEVD